MQTDLRFIVFSALVLSSLSFHVLPGAVQERTHEYFIDHPEEYEHAHILLSGQEHKEYFKPEATLTGDLLELAINCIQVIESEEDNFLGLDQGFKHVNIEFHMGGRNVLAKFKNTRVAFGGEAYCCWDKSYAEVVYVDFD